MNVKPDVRARVVVQWPTAPLHGRTGVVVSHSEAWDSLVYVDLDPVEGVPAARADKFRAIDFTFLEFAPR